MAKNKPKRAGRPCKYKWLDLFGSLPRTLIRGHDFDCEPASMGIHSRRMAKKFKVTVMIMVHEDKVIIVKGVQ